MGSKLVVEKLISFDVIVAEIVGDLLNEVLVVVHNVKEI